MTTNFIEGNNMSSKYTLVREFVSDGQTSEVKHTFYADTHDEVAQRFNEFLRGCGFYFYDGESYQLMGCEDTYSTTELGDAVLDQYDTEDWATPTEGFNNLPQNNWPFYNKNVICPNCGMTRAQMGGSACYEKAGCGLGLDVDL